MKIGTRWQNLVLSPLFFVYTPPSKFILQRLLGTKECTTLVALDSHVEHGGRGDAAGAYASLYSGPEQGG
jgi:hypothetical protein